LTSSDPDARSLPSPLNATDQTQLCACSVDNCAPVSADHTIVSSDDADARSLPSPLNATEKTQWLCPCSVDLPPGHAQLPHHMAMIIVDPNHDDSSL